MIAGEREAGNVPWLFKFEQTCTQWVIPRSMSSKFAIPDVRVLQESTSNLPNRLQRASRPGLSCLEARTGLSSAELNKQISFRKKCSADFVKAPPGKEVYFPWSFEKRTRSISPWDPVGHGECQGLHARGLVSGRWVGKRGALCSSQCFESISHYR